MKQKKKKKDGGLLAPLLAPKDTYLIAYVASSFISLEKDSRRLEEESVEQEEHIMIWIGWIRFFSPTLSYRQYQDY